jgi:pimeloyl-CoA dehydrogenase
MDFSFNDDHIALRDAVQRFCDGEYPAHQRGNPETPDIAAKRWAGMAELGLLGLPFDTELGGSGQSAIELMLVAQELGRSLGGAGWLGSVVLAGQLLAEAGTPAQCSRWLPALARGDLRLALAFAEADSRYDLARAATTARTQGGACRINGRKTLVLDGDSADLFLVVARSAGATHDRHGLTIFAVDANQRGVSVHPFSTLDARRAAHVDFDDVEVDVNAIVGTPGAALPLLEAAVDRAAAALCAEAAGAMEALLDLTAEHLKTRKQFGAPLAKFQALQHRVADMLIALEQVKSMACAAAMAVDAGDVPQRERIVSAAKALTGQLGRQVGLAAIQLHGAMGMTDECRAGHYAKRLLVINQLFGDAAHHLQRLSSLTETA